MQNFNHLVYEKMFGRRLKVSLLKAYLHTITMSYLVMCDVTLKLQQHIEICKNHRPSHCECVPLSQAPFGQARYSDGVKRLLGA